MSDITDSSTAAVHKNYTQRVLISLQIMFRYARKAFILELIHRDWFARQGCCISWSPSALQWHVSFLYV